MTDYFSYKKIYTTGGMFNLSGDDFVGFAQYKDGIVTDYETGDLLEPTNTYETDLFTSRTFKDRTIDDFAIKLPIPRSECLFDLNETLNLKAFQYKLNKIRENNTFVFSRLSIASNKLPRTNLVTYSALNDVDDTNLTTTSLTGDEVFGTPVFSNATETKFRQLGDVFDITTQVNYDDLSKFALFGVTETSLISLTGDDSNMAVIEASTNYETISSNVLEFGKLGGVASNTEELFVSDTENNTIIKYDITGYLNNDIALGNKRYITSINGGEGLTDRRANFSEPTALAANEKYLAVFDSKNLCVKVFNTNLDYYTTLTFINLNKALNSIETFSTMAFDPDFNDLYILTTTDSRRVILYRANLQTRQLEQLNITGTLDSDEVIKSIAFSKTDSNYWYYNTNKRVFKKYKTRPTQRAVGFYDEARLGDFRSSIIGETPGEDGENRWNRQETNFNKTGFFWNFKPEAVDGEPIITAVAGQGVSTEAQKFRGFNILTGPGGDDKIVLFTKSRIYHFNEPSTTAYQSVLNRQNYTNYGINGFSLSPHEYIQVATINSEFYKLVYDLLILKNNLIGRFAGKYVNGQLVLDNPNYNIDFSKLKRENVEDYFIHHNEENIVGALNRTLAKLYELQEFIINAVQVDVGTQVSQFAVEDAGPEPEPEPEPVEPELSITKEVDATSPGPYFVGDEVTYKVTLVNSGNAPADNIRLRDSLSDIDVISDPRGILTGNVTVNEGETITVKYKHALTGVGVLKNTATASGDISVSDSTTINVSDLSDLTMTKEIVNEPAELTVGDTLTYRVTVTNNSTAGDAADLELTDSLNVTNITGDGSDMFTGGLIALQSGSSVSVTYDYTIQSSDVGSTIKNTVTLTADPGDGFTVTLIDSVTTSGIVVGSQPGEEIFTQSGNFIVPNGVTSVSVVLVGSGKGDSGHSEFGGVVAYGSNGNTPGGYANADGGGTGGTGGPTTVSNNGGTFFTCDVGCGGGAAGYTGNGGNAGVRNNVRGKSGTGGGGAGGTFVRSGDVTSGGGVGLLGEGTSGTECSATSIFDCYFAEGGSGGANGDGYGMSQGNVPVIAGGSYGGGYSSGMTGCGGTVYNIDSDAGGGGGLAWKNNISVTPGSSLPVTVDAGGNGAVRIIWGPNRAFPSTNTGQL